MEDAKRTTGRQRLSADNKDFREEGLRRLAQYAAASSEWRAGPEVGLGVEKQLLRWAGGVEAAADFGGRLIVVFNDNIRPIFIPTSTAPSASTSTPPEIMVIH